jgi:hypothetical protein
MASFFNIINDCFPVTIELKKRVETLEGNTDQNNFIRTLENEHVKAKAEFPDFDDAYSFYIQNVAETIIDDVEERGHEIEDEEALTHAKTQLAKLLKGRVDRGLSVGSYLYRTAKRMGYTPKSDSDTPKPKKGFNAKKTAKNREKTERKTGGKRPDPVINEADRQERMKKYYKNGQFDVKMYRSDLQKEIGKGR